MVVVFQDVTHYAVPDTTVDLAGLPPFWAWEMEVRQCLTKLE